MARFSVPSASSSSSDGGSNTPQKAGSQSQSPPNKPKLNAPKPYSKHPGMFRVPSASTSPTNSSDGSRSPKRSRSRSGSPANSASPKRPKRDTSIPKFRVPSASSSSEGSDENSTLSGGSGSPAHGPLRSRSPAPSPPSSTSKLATGLFKKPGELGQFQTNSAKLIVLNEKSGKLPKLGNTSPRSPGFSWDDGAVWWLPRAEYEDIATPGQTLICREHVDQDGDPGPSPATVESAITLLAHHNLVRPYGHAGFDKDDTRNETAWEFMDAGTLNHLVMSRKIPPGVPTKKIAIGLPEYLVWHALASLLKAVTYLQTGICISQDSDDSAGWRPVVHNFINPANVFFTHPVPNDDGPNPSYGTCKLGNFSRCTILPHDFDPVSDEEVADRKEAFEHILALGEESGYEAPELLIETDELPSPRSDLWSIGAVMLVMMTGRTVWDLLLEHELQNDARKRQRESQLPESWQDVPLAYRHALMLGLTAQGTIVSELPEKYSHELRVLVETLLVMDPEDRGDAGHVLTDVEKRFERRRNELRESGNESEYLRDDTAAEEAMRRSRVSRGLPPDLTEAERSNQPLSP